MIEPLRPLENRCSIGHIKINLMPGSPHLRKIRTKKRSRICCFFGVNIETQPLLVSGCNCKGGLKLRQCSCSPILVLPIWCQRTNERETRKEKESRRQASDMGGIFLTLHPLKDELLIEIYRSTCKLRSIFLRVSWCMSLSFLELILF